MKKSVVVLLILLVILIGVGWKVYPYIMLGIDYLNEDESNESEKDLGISIKEHLESGKIQSDPKIVKALKNISEDLPKASDSLSTDEQKEVVILAKQAIESTLNNEEGYVEKLEQVMDAYRSLPSDEQQGMQLSIGKSINMRDVLTLKKKLD